MNGRIYAPQLGRFLSADPFIPNPDDAQSYNRYSYVQNQPFKYTDPSGFLPFNDNVRDSVLDAMYISPMGWQQFWQYELTDYAMSLANRVTYTLLDTLPDMLLYQQENEFWLGQMTGESALNPSGIGGSVGNPGFANNQGGYSPDRAGWHDYTEGPNMVCAAELNCSSAEMADQLSRFAVPGQDPSLPVSDLSTYWVYDPRYGFPAGKVLTEISSDGLTVINTTLPLHGFYDGKIIRTASQGADGAWYMTTHGYGNNVIPGAAWINEWQGPKIFNYLDQQMRNNIEAHH